MSTIEKKDPVTGTGGVSQFKSFSHIRSETDVIFKEILLWMESHDWTRTD